MAWVITVGVSLLLSAMAAAVVRDEPLGAALIWSAAGLAGGLGWFTAA